MDAQLVVWLRQGMSVTVVIIGELIFVMRFVEMVLILDSMTEMMVIL